MIRKVALGAVTTALAVTATLAGLAPVASAATVSPTGIDATGTSDDTSALQTLIDGLPDNSTLVFPAGGKYRIEGTLHVRNKNNLTIEGNGSLFFATTTGDRTRSQWSFERGSNILVRDVVVKGANPYAGTSSAAYVSSLEAQHAFNIFSTNGIELDHVTATDLYGDFVYIGSQSGPLARNVYIHDSTFARNGRQGISVTGGDGVRIIHNTISGVRRTTFDLEPNGTSWGALNVDIENNTIGSGRLNLLSSQGVGPVADITFANNTINRPVTVVVRASDGARRGPFAFTDNTATRPWGSAAGSAALSFTNVDGLTIKGNTIPLQDGRGDYGVKAINSCDVNVSGNNFPGAIDDLYTTPGPSCTTTTEPVTNPGGGPSSGGSGGPGGIAGVGTGAGTEDGVTRLAGANRYETSVQIGRAASPGTKTVVIASGISMADAVVAGPLAAHLGAPLLLTAESGLPSAVVNDLAARNADTAYLVGGTKVISQSVERQLRAAGVTQVVRMGGADRFGTAALVARKIGTAGHEAVVINGADRHLVDGFTVGGLAGRLGHPILLGSTNGIPGSTSDALAALGVTATTVVGASLPSSVVASLPGHRVIAGMDRFDTAVAVAKSYANVIQPGVVVLANGSDRFPVDALSAAALGRPVLLVTPKSVPSEVTAWLSETSSVTSVTVAGGPASIGISVARDATRAARVG